MADLSITAANVIPSASASFKQATVAPSTTIVAGKLLYKITATGDDKGKVGLCDANGASPLYVPCGIAVSGGGAGQRITYVESDPALVIGAAVAIGDVYIASETAGGIKPYAEVGAGDFVTVVAVGVSTTAVNFSASGLAAGAAKA